MLRFRRSYILLTVSWPQISSGTNALQYTISKNNVHILVNVRLEINPFILASLLVIIVCWIQKKKVYIYIHIHIPLLKPHSVLNLKDVRHIISRFWDKTALLITMVLQMDRIERRLKGRQLGWAGDISWRSYGKGNLFWWDKKWSA